MRKITRTSWVVGLASLVLALSACSDAATSDDDAPGEFVARSEDELVDAGDPPTDPDPLDPDDDAIGIADSTVSTRAGTGPGGGPACVARQALSPKGLTFVIHISKRGANADRALDHLKTFRRYIRARDIFMVEERSDVVDRLHAQFPCNRFHYIAYPDEMKAALATGGLIDGIAVDWEGGKVEASSPAWSVDRLHDYVEEIRKAGKTPGFVPSWSSRFDDAAIANASKMDYELAQIQGGCVNGPSNFGNAAKRLIHDFHGRGFSLRNVGFEISMDSFGSADNHVSAGRSAECTRVAYGKGARSIYLYGNGHDQLPDYFRALGKMGVRTAH